VKTELDFQHLENAHVLGQKSTYWHVKVHWLMLLLAVRNLETKEIFGQIFRMVGAATKTAIGLVPAGNTVLRLHGTLGVKAIVVRTVEYCEKIVYGRSQ